MNAGTAAGIVLAGVLFGGGMTYAVRAWLRAGRRVDRLADPRPTDGERCWHFPQDPRE